MPSRRAAALGSCLALALGCTAPDHPPGPFCETIRALERGEIAIEPGPNEMAGHVSSLDALLEVAPRAVRDDLLGIREQLAAVRDAGGLGTLLVFAELQDPELAGMEGRITEYVASQCDLRRGPPPEGPSYVVGEPVDGATRCPAWSRAGSPLTNNRFPYLLDTSSANYFAAQYWAVPWLPAPPGFLKVERGGFVELRGEYPFARYFSSHPNDVETNNLDTLRDVELEPDPGSQNPWREAVGEGLERRYTARIVFGSTPERPDPNTMYVGERANGGFNPVLFLLYRIYGADQGSMPPNSAGAPLPAVTIHDADGSVRAEYEACDPYPPGAATPRSAPRATGACRWTCWPTGMCSTSPASTESSTATSLPSASGRPARPACCEACRSGRQMSTSRCSRSAPTTSGTARPSIAAWTSRSPSTRKGTTPSW
jgi:hypothetical protein